MSSPPSPSASTNGSIDGCPVDHSKFNRPTNSTASPLLTPPANASSAALVCDSSTLTAPTAASSSSSSSGIAGPSIVGDLFPDSNPQPNQKRPLSSAPVASTIPKGGPDLAPDATWIFPSPQRFFNAMTKKGWNPQEPDMAWVVSIHNTVNEQTWKKVQEYEKLHSCPNPKLVRFKGRPSDLSPKARILSWFGYVAPFDRHDWVVDRCGKEVRYVIDFYAGAGSEMAMALPGMPPAIHLDVRPALDSPMNAVDRLRWQFKQWFGERK